jgi:hypothetical protein
LIAAINIFAMLGDAILSEDTYSKDTSDPTGRDVVSSIDAIDDDAPYAGVRKSRLKKSVDENGNKLKLAWASNRAPAMYLIPDSVMTMTLADMKLGSFMGPRGAQDSATRATLLVQTEADRNSNGARIPRESKDQNGLDTKKMEQLLESEYMPFYFHDLRTNEIVAFHAFLTSLSDDYTPNWDTIDGYGRVDPIKIYKNTNRRIGMSFYVAALDERDFDEMWMKLNKLVTLVYPQYTKGRSLNDGNTSFVQPFSQLIGASPLIRIRLGDLIKSNYSRFALARLFGAADGDMQLDSTPIKFEGAANIFKDPKNASLVRNAVKKAKDNSSSEYTLTSAGWASAMEPGGAGVAVSVGGPSTPDQAATMAIDQGDLGYFTFKIIKQLGNGMVAVKPSIMSAADIMTVHGFDPGFAELMFTTMTNNYNNANNADKRVVGGKSGYAVPRGALKLSLKTFGKIIRDSTGISTAIENIEQVSAFLDIEKNALVKSFRAIQGQGLGGVIESMNFDWYDRVTWEIKPGHRAPKMCKVTIGFAPIHDISPGIDHMGYNRAPIYPVGMAMGNANNDPDKSG